MLRSFRAADGADVMPGFALQCTAAADPVTGMIVRGKQVDLLIRKLRERRSHYETLWLSMGDGWAALTSPGHQSSADLPWLADGPIYLYTLIEGCFCQFGFVPNVPRHFHGSMLGALRRHAGLDAELALTSEGPDGLIYDLGRSCAVVDADLEDIG